jgi:hypothetical protein
VRKIAERGVKIKHMGTTYTRKTYNNITYITWNLAKLSQYPSNQRLSKAISSISTLQWVQQRVDLHLKIFRVIPGITGINGCCT